MANIKDVARKAGVSIATVSRVINNNALVNADTREMVEKAMEDLNYVPNRMAQGMRTNRSNTIGIIIPEYINPFYHQLFHYMEDEAHKEGYKILVSSNRGEINKEIDHIKDLISRRIDGIVICTYRGDEKMISYITEVGKQIPIVFLDNIGDHVPVNAVYTDGYKAIRQMTLHLIDRGHRKIGFVRGLKQYHVARDRYAGYLDALEERGVEKCSDWVFEGDFHIESGYKAGQYFVEQCGRPPTAIVASSDLMAMGIMNYLLSRGIRIPDDVAVAGFDDIFISRLTYPALTTVSQPMKEIASNTIDLIMHKIMHPKSRIRKVVLEGVLKIRHSTDKSKPDVMDILI